MSDSKQQFAIVGKDGAIEAIIVTRGNEFYCYEIVEDSPKNFKEAMAHYPSAKLVELTLSEKGAIKP
jgi:hypothetical protein